MVSSNVPTGWGISRRRRSMVTRRRRTDPAQALRPQVYTPVLPHEAPYPAYGCSRAWMETGDPHCIAFYWIACRRRKSRKHCLTNVNLLAQKQQLLKQLEGDPGPNERVRSNGSREIETLVGSIPMIQLEG